MRRFTLGVMTGLALSLGSVNAYYHFVVRPDFDAELNTMSELALYDKVQHVTDGLNQARAKAELEIELKETQDILFRVSRDYKLLTTFQDAGIVPENVEEVFNLVQEFDKIPFGSPFKSGFRVTDPYGNGQPTWYRPSGVHRGLDLIPLRGDGTILATADGEIIDYGVSETIGKWILFETTTGYRIKYAHLRTIFYQDADGKVDFLPIKKGERIGYIGDTGTLATGIHLHMEILKSLYDGSYVHLDPEQIALYVGARRNK